MPVSAWRSISGSRIASRPARRSVDGTWSKGSCEGSRTKGPGEIVLANGGDARSGEPGLLLQDDVALDRECAAAGPEVEQLDEIGVDVELVTGATEPAGDAEAEALAPVGEPEG